MAISAATAHHSLRFQCGQKELGRKQSAERGVEKNGKMSQSSESSGFLRVKLMVFVFWVVGREWKTTYKKV